MIHNFVPEFSLQLVLFHTDDFNRGALRLEELEESSELLRKHPPSRYQSIMSSHRPSKAATTVGAVVQECRLKMDEATIRFCPS